MRFSIAVPPAHGLCQLVLQIFLTLQLVEVEAVVAHAKQHHLQILVQAVVALVELFSHLLLQLQVAQLLR
jgi:hypothetical protein